MANVSSSNTTTLYSTTQTTPIVPGAAVTTGPVNTTNFTTLYSQTNGVPGGGASDDLLVKGNLRVLGTSDLEGQVTIGNSYSLPTADGTAGQVMTTDGNGNVSFVNSIGTTYDFNASSVAGGANLNLVGSDSTTDTVKLTDGGHITATYTSATVVTLGSDATDANTASAIVSRDASGNFIAGQGSFDSGIKINGSTSGSSAFTAPSTGSTLSYVLPGASGAVSTVLTNDGSGNLSWTTPPGATYTIDASSTSGGANFNLQNGGTDTIKFSEGSNITITATSTNEITIAATGTSTFGNLQIGVASPNTISSTTSNIDLSPNGSSFVQLQADVFIGRLNTDVQMSSNGTADLIFTTNNNVNSGGIRLNHGVAADIDILPEATGRTNITNTTLNGGMILKGSTSGTISIAPPAIAGTQAYTLPTAVPAVSGYVLSSTTGGVMSWAANGTTSTFGNLSIGVVTANTIASTNVNGNVIIEPNGTGNILLTTDHVQVGNGTATARITTNGAYDLLLDTNGGFSGSSLEIDQGSSGGVKITTQPLGGVQVISTYIRLGEIATSGTSTLTTFGTDLVLSTQFGSLSQGTITVAKGAGSNISITPNGAGRTNIKNTTLTGGMILNGSSSGTISITPPATAGTQAYTLPTAVPAVSGYVLSSDTSGTMSWAANGGTGTFGNVTIGVDTVQTISTTTGNLVLQTAAGVNSGTVTIASGTNSNISLVPNGIGRTSITNGTITNNLQFNGGTSGTVQFAAPAIAGTQAYTLPTAVPAVSGYVLSSDTSGTMSWVDNTATSTFGNVTIGVDTAQTISTTSGNLVLQTAAGVNTGTITIASGTNGALTLDPDGTGDIQMIAGTTRFGINNLDATITTSGTGDLILRTNQGSAVEGQITIADGVNGNITIAPNGSGKIKLTTNTVELSTGNISTVGSTGVPITMSVNDATWGTSTVTISEDITLDTDINGKVYLQSDKVYVGNVLPAAITTITTQGASDLRLSTNDDVNSGYININDGVGGHITLEPNGSGQIFAIASKLRLGDLDTAATITTQGTGNLTLDTNNGTNSGSILIANGANGNITVEPNGTGDVNLNADTVRIGDSGAAATLTTNGAGNLTLSTNAGSAGSATIVMGQGTSGSVTVTNSTSGFFVVVGSSIFAITPTAANQPAAQFRSTVTSSATDDRPSVFIAKARSDITFASMTDEPAVMNFTVRDSTNTNRQFGRWIGRYAGTATNPVFTLRGSPDGFTTNLHYMTIGGGVGTFGSTSSTYTLTSNTGSPLVLTANANVTSGTITVASGTNANISLTPNGTGRTAITNGTITNPLILASYTAAALTALTGSVGAIAAVTDSAGGGHPNGMMAFWDTTNARWSYVHDNSAV